MLSTTDLASMRATLGASLPDTAQVQRATRQSDGMGGVIETWDLVATVPCRLSPAGLTPQERLVAERVTSQTTWVVTLPAGTDVTAADRLLVGGRMFEVIGVQGRGAWEISRRVIVAEVAT